MTKRRFNWTPARTKRELEKIVRKFGYDHVYNHVYKDRRQTYGGSTYCVYFDQDGGPSCIVGQLFARAGIEPFRYTSSDNHEVVNALDSLRLVDFRHDETRKLLHELQRCQDSGATWGSAVAGVFATVKPETGLQKLLRLVGLSR